MCNSDSLFLHTAYIVHRRHRNWITVRGAKKASINNISIHGVRERALGFTATRHLLIDAISWHRCYVMILLAFWPVKALDGRLKASSCVSDRRSHSREHQCNLLVLSMRSKLQEVAASKVQTSHAGDAVRRHVLRTQISQYTDNFHYLARLSISLIAEMHPHVISRCTLQAFVSSFLHQHLTHRSIKAYIPLQVVRRCRITAQR